jgi:hypothetical protein
MRRARWAQTSLVTRVTLWYTLLLGAVLVVVGVVVAGTLSRWIETDSMNQLMTQGQEVRLALVAAADTGRPFSDSAMQVLSGVLGRDVQASVWAIDGRLIARSEGGFILSLRRVVGGSESDQVHHFSLAGSTRAHLARRDRTAVGSPVRKYIDDPAHRGIH